MSFQIELDPKEQASVDLISSVGDQLQCAYIDAKARTGLTQQSLAVALGVDRSRINRCLSGYNNLTLKTLAEISWALDKTVHVRLCEPHQEVYTRVHDAGSNFFKAVLFEDNAHTSESTIRAVRKGSEGAIYADVSFGT